MKQIEYPVRINKYLAMKGICSRREADDLVASGKVCINGKRAELGARVFQGENVTVSEVKKEHIYLAYHKPKGIVTHSPQKKQKSVKDIIMLPKGVFPLGRLDRESRGLLLFTDDGRITQAILDPKLRHEKEYEVKVNKVVTDEILDKLSRGVVLDDGYRTRRCRAQKTGGRTFRVILTEGKKHQIRRMCATVGWEVEDLFRVRIMHITLGDLKENTIRPFTEVEKTELFHVLEM